MIRSMRMNAHPTRERAEEEAAGLRIAFATHPVAQNFTTHVSLYQDEWHVVVTGDVDTSIDGFLSVIVARVLASHCRAPASPMRLPRAAQAQSSIAPRQRFNAIGAPAHRLTRG